VNWAETQRQEWISETLRVFRFINREHIMRKFGVSMPQASLDLRRFNNLCPNMMVYNATTKRYELKVGDSHDA
jgi:hypothetical protein